MRQHLIYIGRDPLAMPDGIREPGLDYRYGLLDMRQVDCARLLALDDPDALVLAVLCDFGERDPQAVVNQIFLRLKALVGHQGARLWEYLDMIEVLADNRALKPYIKEAEQMLTQVDVTQLSSYELGMEAGMQAGKVDALLSVARALLGLLPDEVIADKTGLTLAQVRDLRRDTV